MLSWADIQARLKGGDVRMYPKVAHGSFMPVPKGSVPIRSAAPWTTMPGRTRTEKRQAWRERNKRNVQG